MRTLLSICIAAAGWTALNAHACEVPAVVIIPEGANASADQLRNAQTRIRDYMASMDDYIACLEGQIASVGGPEQAPAAYMALMINRHNAAVDEMTHVMQSFNEQVRAYNTIAEARTGSESELESGSDSDSEAADDSQDVAARINAD